MGDNISRRHFKKIIYVAWSEVAIIPLTAAAMVYIISYSSARGGSAMIVLKWRMLSLLPRIRIKSPKLWLVMFYRMPYTLILLSLTLLLFISLALSRHFRLAPTVRL